MQQEIGKCSPQQEFNKIILSTALLRLNIHRLSFTNFTNCIHLRYEYPARAVHPTSEPTSNPSNIERLRCVQTHVSRSCAFHPLGEDAAPPGVRTNARGVGAPITRSCYAMLVDQDQLSDKYRNTSFLLILHVLRNQFFIKRYELIIHMADSNKQVNYFQPPLARICPKLQHYQFHFMLF